MRVMMIIKSDARLEAGALPPAEAVTAMARYNEALAAAGVVLSAEGLQPSAKGALIHYAPGSAARVVDGPFAEAKELIAGFWILQVASRAEAIEWAAHCPGANGEYGDFELELRPLMEPADIPEAVS